jgi:hypothetical protein
VRGLIRDQRLSTADRQRLDNHKTQQFVLDAIADFLVDSTRRKIRRRARPFSATRWC